MKILDALDQRKYSENNKRYWIPMSRGTFVMNDPQSSYWYDYAVSFSKELNPIENCLEYVKCYNAESAQLQELVSSDRVVHIEPIVATKQHQRWFLTDLFHNCCSRRFCGLSQLCQKFPALSVVVKEDSELTIVNLPGIKVSSESLYKMFPNIDKSLTLSPVVQNLLMDIERISVNRKLQSFLVDCPIDTNEEEFLSNNLLLSLFPRIIRNKELTQTKWDF